MLDVMNNKVGIIKKMSVYYPCSSSFEGRENSSVAWCMHGVYSHKSLVRQY